MIVVVGSLNYDLTVRTARFPQPGEAVIGESFTTACGGKGANQAYAVARMGGRVAMIGCVGKDAFGEASLASLEAVGVDTRRVLRRGDVSTGVAFILLDASGQNEIVVAPGANRTLSAADLAQFVDVFGQARAVITQLETTLEATRAALEQARAAGAIAVLNPAPFAPLEDAVLRACDFLIPNENEAANLCACPVRTLDEARAAAVRLRARGARNVLITLGANGVWVEAEQWQGHVPAFTVPVVDTVAAGDVFIGAFVTRLVEGADVREAARFGCAAAAIAVTRPGAQPSIPSRQEVEAFLSA